MLVNLRDLRERGEPLRSSRPFSEAELSMGGDMLRLRGPAECSLTVALKLERVRVKGSVQAQVDLKCCRCLKSFPHEVEQEFDLTYEPDPEVEEGEEIALSYGDLEIGFYRNDELDLSLIVGEQVLLEIPMKPVCREDCKGLCSHCGADLNEGLCDCSPQSFDPRLEPLRQLKKNMID